MEFLFLSMTATSGIFAFLLFLYYVIRMLSSVHRDTNKGSVAPEVSGAWPLIGHLHLLGGPKLSHMVLGDLADKHGPIFTIRLGMFRALVVSDCEIAKECFTTNDKVFANRPNVKAAEHLSYNYAMMGVSPYGPYWREVRKITTLQLLSNIWLTKLIRVCESEVNVSIKNIHELWFKNKAVLVEMSTWLGDIVLNVFLRIIAGKRISSGNALEDKIRRKTLSDFFYLMGVFTVGDALPFLRWLDVGGYEKAMKKTAKELDSLMQGWLDEHKEKRSFGEAKGEQDFVDVLLSILENDARNFPNYDADTTVKATCQGIALASINNLIVTLTWALALLLNNRHALKKAQDELDKHIGRDRQVKESDMKNLVYLQAIIKETLRLNPVTQIAPPRMAVEDCNVGGYHVPAGTTLFVNLWKIHRDPRSWSNPLEFHPERFLTTHKDVDVRGKHFEYLPFGSGRRMCPAASFALQIMQFMLASLLHAFEFDNPSDKPVDMTQRYGLTNAKATPLEVLLTPRLPIELYG